MVSPTNVLLVEDDRAVMMVTTKYIESFGYEFSPRLYIKIGPGA